MASDLAQWLEGLGLGQYAPAFAENEIDFELLPELTENDLEKLGLPMGPRKRLLRAIGRIAEEPAARSAAASAETASRDAERRQLTVLFCDLVGSTALSAALDPEDVREVLRAYQEACAAVIARYDGYLAKFMGDGVFAYFGYPQAHEDDAERAINAGLGIVDAVGALERGLAVRIGVATGPVAVGDLIGAGSSEEAAVVGEAPNLAARLQEIAAPNTVVIGEATQALAGGMFEATALGPRDLKGFAAPVSAWVVLRPRRAESRFEATRGERLTPLVGRDEEMEILLRRWRRAAAGEGQVVLISGEPGIGKSRLARELQDRIADEPHYRLGYQCSPYHTNSALHPVIGQLERAARFAPGDGAATKLDKLEALLALSGRPVADAAPLIAALLSVPAADRYPPLAVTPQKQKELTLEALVAQLAGLAGRQPVLFVLEDAHWIDPTTMELMELAVERVPDRAVLMLITHRPDFAAPWVGRPRVTPMILGRLERRDCERMVADVAGPSAAQDLWARIAARADGVPLFVEELTKSMIEAAAGSSTFAIPETLQDSLEARLDRLGSAKEIAQIGAVIGRSFPYALLAKASGLGESELQGRLERLVASELVFGRGEPPDATYTFKHALVQDAAYGSLLRSRRREIHRAVARQLEAVFAEAETAPETVAYHYTEAGLPDRAVDWWTRAGRAAAEHFANAEAVDHFERALAILAEARDMPDRARRELDVQSALGPSLLALKGFGNLDAGQAFERARMLSTEIGDTQALFRAVWGLWLSHGSGEDKAVREPLVRELLALAERSGDTVFQLQARHAAWGGPYEVRREAHLQHIEHGLAVYDPARHVATAQDFGGHDAGVCGLSHAATTLWTVGRPDQAIERCRQARDLAERIAYPPARVQAATWSAMVHLYARDWAEARRLAESGIRIGRDRGTLQFVYMALPVYGRALVAVGEAEAGFAAFDESVRVFRDSHMGASFRTALKSEANLALGRLDEALALADEAVTLAHHLREEAWLPNTHRLKGEILLALAPDRPAEAEACFETALAIARDHGARMWELKAATALAGLWHAEGKTVEARDLLTPLYGWFTEGFETADLKEAKAVMDALNHSVA